MTSIDDTNFKYSDYKDLHPLVFSSIHNIITDNDFLSAVDEKIKYNGFSGGSYDEKMTAIDDILTNSTIKKGCCMYEKGTGTKSDMIQTTVKIPVPETINSSLDDYGMNTGDSGWLADNYSFYNKTIYFSESLCPKQYLNESQEGTDLCDDFFYMYCANQKQDLDNKYDKDNTRVRQSEFVNFSPECACFGDMSAYEAEGIYSAPVCLLEGCSVDNKIYLDPVSRQANGTCDASFCTSTINLSDAEVGQNMDINYANTQNCSNTVRADAAQDALSNGLESISDLGSDLGSNLGSNLSDSSLVDSEELSSLLEKIWYDSTYKLIFIAVCFIIIVLILILLFKPSKNKFQITPDMVP